ncbi:ATP-binding protein [Haloimpatiens sp. FM7330]|uniref:HAMP domain-containing sensor histidine kinase n=1 Tax=Haloimpatiens sp. FM7330 TaxID=3298610 RepID=UPI0036416D8E
MKFRWKIFLLCIVMYISTLIVVGVIITENNYRTTLHKEIKRSLKEQNNIYSNTILYLIVNQKQSEDKINIGRYSQRIVEMFKDDKSYIEIYDDDGNLLAPHKSNFQYNREDEIQSSLKGKRNYILRKNDESHFLFVNQEMKIENKKLILCYIKDISQIDIQRKQEYKFFTEVGLIGLIFIGIITGIISKIIMKPVENLNCAAQNISQGDYKNRVNIHSNDEIGVLARQFNKMADEIENKITELKHQSDTKQRLVDNITHELRTPLTSIIGYAEVLMKIKYDEQTFHKGLKYIYSEGKRMLKLINMLMKMILTREDPLQISTHNVFPILKEVQEIMKIKAEEKEIQIEIIGEDVEINLDKDMIKGVLINLIDNSIKASKEGSIIKLGMGKNEKSKNIYVQDEGKGMEEEEINKILEPFYRIDKSRSRKEGGVGLGLALCSEIVKKHNAQLKIQSKINEGTIIKIIF